MTKRNIVFLLSIFIVLMAISWWPKIAEKLPKPKAKPVVDFSAWHSGNTSQITIKQGSQSAVLLKQEGKWKIAGFKSDEGKIKDLINSLQNTEVKYTVSENTLNQEEYSLSTASGTNLSLKGPEKNLSLVTGKKAPLENGYYFRLEDSDRVYVASGDLPDKLNTQVSYWRDKTVANLDSHKLTEIKISGQKSFILRKNADNKWQLIYGNKTTDLKSEDINGILDKLMPLTADGFADTNEKDSFRKSRHDWTVNITGSDFSSQLQAQTQDGYFLVSYSGNPEIYKIYNFNLNPLITVWEKSQ
ncbi:hypothetical protein A3J20_04010 [Candidatus Gottesmanbacteria bacterium RIFCSPLOWO2_02_FULL_42_29]|uniref:DUF4340 domain-containing protein n=2 Tax=Candidatus Gottesmaniibacteriota TaxID=1752720 RepID=A0A1F6BBG1_9BACT|nr:MAG: hypothetical protein UV09_C0018G0028 [Candidatus Gottesmanbacteria bacterium GW2011_GWA2_42_18]OGG10733.1 MAG: hypothetical protein A2781_03635 [Candidatus Gottesmanbacteria bacterium RIFCSPHIGHO2_01_FULL_42_27]OGG21896.1 MAG: hypothetical protein A3E72_01570 [Candidatus Gottesmanbacteria bacterium RIFCSPHIGHO2_12_FULL_43_26]OGG34208.1 MAG: hypothetical protein A2968_03515 [Candidatus Gottesmanbacteria bacterium RIFCSPLOWO2_01_FULL_42_22]OGG36114.1 MAG: hypothetical protein A3G68_03820 